MCIMINISNTLHNAIFLAKLPKNIYLPNN
jgi:hypothetical protein